MRMHCAVIIEYDGVLPSGFTHCNAPVMVWPHGALINIKKSTVAGTVMMHQQSDEDLRGETLNDGLSQRSGEADGDNDDAKYR